MPTVYLDQLREEFPGRSDEESASALAKRDGYAVIVAFKHVSSTEYDHLGCCPTAEHAQGYLNNPNCKDPKVVYGDT